MRDFPHNYNDKSGSFNDENQASKAHNEALSQPEIPSNSQSKAQSHNREDVSIELLATGESHLLKQRVEAQIDASAFPIAIEYSDSYPVTVEKMPMLAQGIPQPETLEQAFDLFLKYSVADGMATKDTRTAYEVTVRDWFGWLRAQGITPLEAKRVHVEIYREHLKQQDMKVSTRSHKLSVIRRLYDAAVHYGLLEKNPASLVRGGKDLTPPEEHIKALTTGALDKFLNNISDADVMGKRDRIMQALMGLHGLRCVEIHRMSHEHLTIESLSPPKASVKVHGKGHQTRQIPLREDVAHLLLDYLSAKQSASVPEKRDNGGMDGYPEVFTPVFVSLSNHQRGHRISRRAIRKITDKHLRHSDLKQDGISCHALRHTQATAALAGGAKMEYVSRNLGHKTLNQTMTYVHLLDKEKFNPAYFINVKLRLD